MNPMYYLQPMDAGSVQILCDVTIKVEFWEMELPEAYI